MICSRTNVFIVVLHVFGDPQDVLSTMSPIRIARVPKLTG